MALVTVITPTYNRGDKLVDLFESLQNQTSDNFEWLIVDDGSTDSTAAQVKHMMERANFKMRYLQKENGGKHTALNVGIKTISTELTFIVDSDDTVLPNGISEIETFYEKYQCVPGVGVLCFLRQNGHAEPLVKIPTDEYVGGFVAERIKKDRPGDMAEVFFSGVLKEFPFPEFQGEKFLSEDVVWIPLGIKYKTVFINRAIYQCEYLQDGLTRNDKKYKFASPLGSMMRGKMLMRKECGLKARIKGAIIYDCYKMNVKEEIPDCLKIDDKFDKFLLLILYPTGFLFNMKWKNDVCRNKHSCNNK